MAANMQHMMMPQAQQQQLRQQALMSLRQIVYTSMNNHPPQPHGWQASYPVADRVTRATNLITNVALALNSVDLTKATDSGISFEREVFFRSPTKELYEQQMQAKTQEFFRKREQNEPNIRNTLNAQAAAAAQGQAAAQAQAQQLLMNQNMMQMGRGIGPNQGPGPQQGFPHVQHPMQGGQMPQHQGPMSMNMNQINMGMHMGMPGPGGQPMGPNAQMMGMAGGRPARPQQPGNANDMGAFTAQDRQRALEKAVKLMATMGEPQKTNLRASMARRISPQQLQLLQSQGRDPVLLFLQNQALQEIQRARMGNAAGQINPAAQAALLQQRQMSQGGPMPGAPHQMPGNNFSQFANVGDLVNQQKAGIRAQEAGQVVVPGGPQQTTQPKPNQPSLPVQGQMNMDQQAAMNQAQLRAAQMPGKQIGPGQPGPMTGPMSQSQSPAQVPANRSAGEGNPMEGPQGMIPGPGPFPAGLDPRFSQANNQRQMASGAGTPNANQTALHSAIINSLTPDQQRNLFSFPPGKQFEIIAKIEQQQRQNMAKNLGQIGPRPDDQQMNRASSGGNVPGTMMPQNNAMNGAPHPGMPVGAGQQQLVNQAMLDSMEFPRPLLGNLKAPPELKTYRDVKQWCAQDPRTQAQLPKIMALQRQQYNHIMRGRAMQLGQKLPPGMNPAMPIAGGAMAGQPLNMSPELQRLIQAPITDQEILQIRNSDPKATAMSDEDVRAHVINLRKLQFMRQQQQQPQQQPQQPLHQQPGSQPAPVQARQVSGPPQQQQPQQQQQQQMQQPAHTQTQQPGAAPATKGSGPQKKPNATPTMSAAAARKASAQLSRTQPSPAPAQKNLKRPFPEEAPETPTQPNAPGAAQRSGSQQGHGQPSLPSLATLTPEQRAKYEQALKNQQMASMANRSHNDELSTRLRAISDDEQRRAAQDPGNEVPLSPQQRQELLANIASLASDFGRVGKVLSKWYSITRDDNRARLFFRTRYRMVRQFHDGERLSQPKEALTITPLEIQRGRDVMRSITKDCQAAFAKSHQATNAAQPQAQQSAVPGGGQAPLSAENLKAQNAALNNKAQQQQRQQQHNAGPKTTQAQEPPAPVVQAQAAATHQFQMGATSPHGQPNYMNKAKDMNLHIPPKKRAKLNHQQNQPQTPAAGRQQPSPRATKATAPEPKKQETKAQTPKPTFSCTEIDCDNVFPTEEARDAHMQAEHIQPRENPLKFFQENLASTLGLDLDGNVLGDVSAASQGTPQPGAAVMSATQSKQGQTPASFAATPMSRGPSMNRSVSGTGPKAQLGSKAGGKAKDDRAKAGDSKDAVTDKAGSAPKSGMTTDPYANCINPKTLFSGVPGFDCVAGGTFTDPSVYRALTPNDTPESSKDSGSSEPNTDLPEFGADLDTHWQPLDDGFMMDLGNINMDSLGTGGVDDLEKSLLLNAQGSVPGADICWEDANIDFDKPFTFDDRLYTMDAST